MKAYESLLQQLDLKRGVPFTPDWSAAPDFLQLIVDHCLEHKPGLIVECSSGLTTLMLARCCQMNGKGKVISLEDGAEYAANVRGYIEQYGLGEYCAVIHSPLGRVSLNGVSYLWYSGFELPEEGIDMLVIDGPSGFIQKNSRYPALPMLYEKLSESCRIFLDDAARPDEREIVGRWQAEFSALNEQYVSTERGCAVLTKP